MVAGQDVVSAGVVVVDVVGRRTDHRQVTHLRSPHVEVFAEGDAWQRGGDRAELAPDLSRCLWLHVPQVDVRRPALHVEEDAGLGRWCIGRACRAGGQQSRQIQSDCSQATDLESSPACQVSGWQVAHRDIDCTENRWGSR